MIFARNEDRITVEKKIQDIMQNKNLRTNKNKYKEIYMRWWCLISRGNSENNTGKRSEYMYKENEMETEG